MRARLLLGPVRLAGCLCAVSVPVLVASASLTAEAQTRTLQFGDRRVVLEVDDDVLVVSVGESRKQWSEAVISKGAVTRREARSQFQGVIDQVVRRQAEIANADPNQLATVAEKTSYVADLGYSTVAVIPRAQQLDTNSVSVLSAAVDRSVRPAFRVRSSESAEYFRLLPAGTISLCFREPHTDELLTPILDTFELDVVEKPEHDPVLVVVRPRDPNAELFLVADRIREQSEHILRWVTPDFASEVKILALPPNDIRFIEQWAFGKVSAGGVGLSEAWEVAEAFRGSENVLIGLLDDGFETSHPELLGKTVFPWDELDRDQDVTPNVLDTHGTHCAGLIGANTNNEKGIAGAAWNCRLVPIRVCESVGDVAITRPNALRDALSRCIAHAANGLRVVSISVAFSPTEAESARDVIERAAQSQILIVAAAGNSAHLGFTDVVSPAKSSNVIAVGAVDRSGKRWEFSNYGPDDELDLMAPSGGMAPLGDILTLDLVGGNGKSSDDYYTQFNGTSAAAPIVASVAALIYSLKPDLTASEVKQCLLESTTPWNDPMEHADHRGYNRRYGFGIVNAFLALQKAQELVAARNGPSEGRLLVSYLPPSQVKLEERELADGEETRSPDVSVEHKVDRFLEAALNAKPIVTTAFGSKPMTLRPKKDWVTVVVDSPEKLPPLLKVGTYDMEKLHPVWETGNRLVYVVATSSLKDAEDFTKAVGDMDESWPSVFPIYEYGGSPLWSNGQVRISVSKDVNRRTISSLVEDLNLEVAEEGADEIILRVTPGTKYTDVFQTAEQFHGKPGVIGAEPDVRMPLR